MLIVFKGLEVDAKLLILLNCVEIQFSVFKFKDNQERFRRPFSADTKDRGPAARTFFKAYSAELINQYSKYNNKCLFTKHIEHLTH